MGDGLLEKIKGVFVKKDSKVSPDYTCPSGNEKSTGATMPGVDTYITYGGATDLWGLTWTPANINAIDFGVVFSVELHGTAVPKISSTALVDHIRIMVFFTEVSDSCTYSSGDWNVQCSDNCSITSDVSLPGNTLFLDGPGSFTILANITANKLIKDNSCRLINKIEDGNRLIIKLG